MLDHGSPDMPNTSSHELVASSAHWPLDKIAAAMLLTMLAVYPIAILVLYKLFFFVAASAAYLIVLYVAFRWRFPVSHFASTTPLLAVFLLSLLSVFWSEFYLATLWSASIFQVFLLVVVLTLLSCHKRSRVLSIARIVCFGFAVLFVILMWMFGTVRAGDLYELSTVLRSLSDAGAAAVILAIPYLAWALMARVGSRSINYAALISAIIVVLLSQSRAAYALLLLFALLMVFWSPREFVKMRWRMLGGILVIVGIAATALSLGDRIDVVKGVADRFFNSSVATVLLGDSPESGEPDYGRAVMYVEGFRAISERPFLGLGFGGLAHQVEKEYGFPMESHNFFLTAWGEMGVPGLALFLWLIYAAIFRVRKARDEQRGANRSEFLFWSATLMSLIAGFLHAQFRPQLSNPMFFVVLALALSSSRSSGIGSQR